MRPHARRCRAACVRMRAHAAACGLAEGMRTALLRDRLKGPLDAIEDVAHEARAQLNGKRLGEGEAGASWLFEFS